MKVFILSFAVLSAFTLTACQTTTHVPARMHYNLNEYSQHNHMKAMAGAYAGMGRGYSYAWSYNRPTAKQAMDRAMQHCQKIRKEYNIRKDCRFYFIGDQDVSTLSGEQIKDVAKRYEKAKLRNEPGSGDGMSTVY